VYVHDPREGGTANQKIAAFDWLFGYLTIPIPCGELATRYAVIAAAPPLEEAEEPVPPSEPVDDDSEPNESGRS
jgi:hypothetical protein